MVAKLPAGQYLKISFSTTINGLALLWWSFFEKIEDLTGIDLSSRTELRVGESLSKIHSWHSDGDEMLEKVGVVTKGESNNYMLFAPNRRHMFFPSGFKRTKQANPRFWFSVLLIIVIVLIGIFTDLIWEAIFEFLLEEIKKIWR